MVYRKANEDTFIYSGDASGASFLYANPGDFERGVSAERRIVHDFRVRSEGGVSEKVF